MFYEPQVLPMVRKWCYWLELPLEGVSVWPTQQFPFSQNYCKNGVEETQRGRERREYEWQTEMEVKYFRKHNYLKSK